MLILYTKFSKISVILAQIELIADPYRFQVLIAITYGQIKKDMSEMQKRN